MAFLHTSHRVIGAISSLITAQILIGCTAVADDDNARQKYLESKHPPISFALVADAPYGDENVGAFDSLIRSVNLDRHVKFVMHGGDIKSGGAECTDERLIARFNQYQKFRKPFIFTPGDNEWTDCHRTSNGGYNPLERLDFIRSLFFPNPGFTTGGRKMRVQSQAYDPGFETYVENTLFSRRNVMFSSIHVVGSNNNLRPWSGIDETDSYDNPRTDRIAEFEAREAASIAWLNKTFDLAEKRHRKGVFILIHANPQFSTNFIEQNRAGFNRFLEVLFQRTQDFGKPVLLAHGDSHVFFTDKPKLVPWYADGDTLSAEDPQTFIPNFTRVQTFGDTPQHWIKVTIDPQNPELFTVAPQVVKENL
ncbi:MAG: hypothetical protein KTR18_16320 [Acidiferrobacterales bacterium]|nr:hypothetical protein [Acidiferrobacterales bacterium]